MRTIGDLANDELDALQPQLRSDLTTRFIDNEILAWSPLNSAPALLDQVASIVYQLLDGSASVADLVADVNEVVGVPKSVARDRLRRALVQFESSGLLLTPEPGGRLEEEPGLFPGPLNT